MTDLGILDFIRDELQANDDLTRESHLFSSGVLDSVAMLSLISFVEDAVGMQVRPEDVTLENFDTAARIISFAESRA